MNTIDIVNAIGEAGALPPAAQRFRAVSLFTVGVVFTPPGAEPLDGLGLRVNTQVTALNTTGPAHCVRSARGCRDAGTGRS